jgi:ATP adenylyltransferase
MENLWAAWRREFILGPKEKGCVFCTRIKQKADRRNLIIHRAEHNIVIMNKFPYNAGHLMIVPKAHKADLDDLTVPEANEMFDLTRKSVKIIREAMPATGFNIGLNLGADAGAGIREHLHIHAVPRFRGDANFMSVVGNAKVQSISMDYIFQLLRPGFKNLEGH